MRPHLLASLVLLSLHFGLATARGDNTTVDQNKALVRAVYDEVFNAGKTDQLEKYITPTAVEHQLMPGQTAPQNVIANLKVFVAAFRTAFPDLKVQVLDIIGEGDKVVARCLMTGTQKGEFMGLPPSNKPIAVEFIDILRFEQGKCVEHWGLSDDAKLMQQLGAPAK
jgi:steroid delta-isomerase-like uncharacterized protein